MARDFPIMPCKVSDASPPLRPTPDHRPRRPGATGETFAQAAVRELREETGIQLESVGESVTRNEFELQLPDGEWVIADEEYFRVRVHQTELSRAGWTPLEVEVMVEHRWWSREELLRVTETVYPDDLADMLASDGTSRHGH
jgi:8-oxo-dGTP pyrophosphatase MutT (NUDIX family)